MTSEISESPKVKATLTVLSESEGGRSTPIRDQPLYRPHIVIGAPHQGTAIVDRDGNCTEHYLGVNFMGDGRVLTSGQKHEVEFALMYYPNVSSSKNGVHKAFAVTHW